MRGTIARPGWRGVAFGLCAVLATISLADHALAQSPSPSVEPSESLAAPATDLFPSADEVSEILGLELVLAGVGGGLSQAWEGSGFGPTTVPSGQMALYDSAESDDEGPLAAVIVDILVFENGDDALAHTRDTMFGEDPVPLGFESGLDADLVATMSFRHEGAGGVFMVLVEGAVVFSITALVRDAPEPETEGTAIARLILERLPLE